MKLPVMSYLIQESQTHLPSSAKLTIVCKAANYITKSKEREREKKSALHYYRIKVLHAKYNHSFFKNKEKKYI